ncbi:MAG: DUF3108 domain-containing protein [Hyphomonadaceae bacterium]
MRALLTILGLLLAAAAPAAAERFSLNYAAAAWGLLPLGDIVLDFDVTDTRYEVDARLQSRGLAALFERTALTAHAAGRIENGAARPEHYTLDHRYSHKRRTIDMTMSVSGVSATIEPTFRLWGEPPASDEQKRAARDPLSSLVAMALDVRRAQGCDGDYLTFDGRFLYRLELRGGAPDHVDTGAYDGPALRCDLRYVAVAGYQPGRGRPRVPEGRIWFALVEGAAFAPPVRITAPLPIGGAHIAVTQWRRPSVEVAGS